ncbi:hypothetical protein HUA78_11235 [Myxococcus sp. CA033]|uniref:hypothetical protein n=1 Tax=Myxococcus sp. CA033 TaxID=2741516 RepID=UPI00157B1D1D|nr:hypothetical protein [Myxococcus sp. CA033]NTX35016.1 hypothetical protein [Myxococcus sp. CA033]
MMGAAALLSLLAVLVQAQVATPQGFPELPIVPREGGWARYEALATDGPSRFVVKVGAPGRYQEKRGRWLEMEIEVPSSGRITIQFLVEGDRFGSNNVLLMRATIPGEKSRETAEPFKKDSAKSRREGKFLQKTTETVAGKTLEVLEYTFSGGITAEWSAAVPGLGLVRMGGENPFHLVDFGVGGDPWKQRTTPAMFPAPPSKK